MNNHRLLDGVILKNFPNHNRVICGVYGIGSVYIGASKNIRKRILSHLRQLEISDHPNKNLSLFYDECLSKKQKPIISYLSINPFDERKLTKITGINTSYKSIFYDQTPN